MTRFWILILIVYIMALTQSGRRWVSAQCPTVSPASHTEKELSVDVGGSVKLQCCDFENKDNGIIWFRIQNGNKSQVLVRYNKNNVEFYDGSQNSRFQIKIIANCYNLTISNTTRSDQATYYCALVPADGTRLNIKGNRDPATSGTSRPSLRENTATPKTREEMALGLGSALGLGLLLILGLSCFLLRRRKMRMAREDSPGVRQESDSETLNYAALQFAKRKTKGEKRETTLQEDCVYSEAQ